MDLKRRGLKDWEWGNDGKNRLLFRIKSEVGAREGVFEELVDVATSMLERMGGCEGSWRRWLGGLGIEEKKLHPGNKMMCMAVHMGLDSKGMQAWMHKALLECGSTRHVLEQIAKKRPFLFCEYLEKDGPLYEELGEASLEPGECNTLINTAWQAVVGVMPDEKRPRTVLEAGRLLHIFRASGQSETAAQQLGGCLSALFKIKKQLPASDLEDLFKRAFNGEETIPEQTPLFTRVFNTVYFECLEKGETIPVELLLGAMDTTQ